MTSQDNKAPDADEQWRPLLNHLPAVKSPMGVRFAIAIFLAFFFFYFTKPAPQDVKQDEPGSAGKGRDGGMRQGPAR